MPAQGSISDGFRNPLSRANLSGYMTRGSVSVGLYFFDIAEGLSFYSRAHLLGYMAHGCTSDGLSFFDIKDGFPFYSVCSP